MGELRTLKRTDFARDSEFGQRFTAVAADNLGWFRHCAVKFKEFGKNAPMSAPNLASLVHNKIDK